MTRLPSLSLVLPTLDEADNLRLLLPELLAEVACLTEVWVMDDGSTDDTAELVNELARRDARVRLVTRTGHRCLTAAIQEGIDRASAELVGWMDADGAMLPADLLRLVETVAEGADVAVGSRFLPRGRMKGQRGEGALARVRALTQLGDTEDPPAAVALSWALNGVVLPLLLREGVHDYTSGFAVGRRWIFEQTRLQGVHGEYFIALWVELHRRGLRVQEVPYAIQPRRAGRSKTVASLRDYGRRGRQYIAAALRARRR